MMDLDHMAIAAGHARLDDLAGAGALYRGAGFRPKIDPCMQRQPPEEGVDAIAVATGDGVTGGGIAVGQCPGRLPDCVQPVERAAEFIKGIVKKIGPTRSEEHTYELQSLMRISSAVFCLKQ